MFSFAADIMSSISFAVRFFVVVVVVLNENCSEKQKQMWNNFLIDFHKEHCGAITDINGIDMLTYIQIFCAD